MSLGAMKDVVGRGSGCGNNQGVTGISDRSRYTLCVASTASGCVGRALIKRELDNIIRDLPITTIRVDFRWQETEA